jgi:hypothetical protein
MPILRKNFVCSFIRKMNQIFIKLSKVEFTPEYSSETIVFVASIFLV